MTHDCRSALSGLDAAENLERILKEGIKHHGYTIVSSDNHQELLGIITHHELEELKAAKDTRKMHEWVEGHKIIEIYPDDSIRDAANTLVVKDVLQAPVVSRKDRSKLLGIVTLHDIARQQNAIEDSMD
jgi:CIC family chloride channel protein